VTHPNMMKKLIAGAKHLGTELSDRQLEQFELYYRELTDWNQRVNLTAITGYEDVQIKHFLDSLTVTLALKSRDSRTNLTALTSHPDLAVLDVGTGAGLPGIPVKIVRPEISLTLLEATAKKARFLEQLKQKLGLADVEIVTARAEEVGHQRRYRDPAGKVLPVTSPVLAQSSERLRSESCGRPWRRQRN